MVFDPRSPETREFVSELTNCQGVLQSFIASLMPGHPDTADVLQETNLILWEKMDEFEPGTNFRAWAFAIARFKVLNHLKKCRNSKLLLFDDELLERICEAAAERSPQTHDAKVHALTHCLEDLRPKDRELVHARYHSPQSLEHYASQIGRPVASLYVTLGRLRTILRRCIQSRLKQEGGLA